jgi:carbonic anhydrase
MELFTDDIMRDLLASSLKTATFDGKVWRDNGAGPGSTEGQFVDWLTIKEQSKSVTADVKRI